MFHFDGAGRTGLSAAGERTEYGCDTFGQAFK